MILIVYFLTTAWVLTKLTLPMWCIITVLGLNAFFAFASVIASVPRAPKGTPNVPRG